LLWASETGRHRDGGAELLGRRGGLAAAHQGDAEVVGRLRVVRLQAQGGAARLDRPVKFAQGAADFAEVGVEHGHVRPQGDGPADQLGRRAVLAELVRDHAEHVEGIGVVGVLGQEGLARVRGLAQAARVVVAEGDLELVLHGGERVSSAARRANVSRHVERRRLRLIAAPGHTISSPGPPSWNNRPR
jgi:hypothetical protein